MDANSLRADDGNIDLVNQKIDIALFPDAETKRERQIGRALIGRQLLGQSSAEIRFFAGYATMGCPVCNTVRSAG